MLVCLGVQVRAVFAQVDENLDVGEQYALAPNGDKPIPLTEAAFLKAFAELAEARGKLAEQVKAKAEAPKE